MRRALLAVLCLIAGPELARAGPLDPVDEVQRGDVIVQSIGWNLAHANARFCARQAAGIGVMLQDARTFSQPDLARQVYGLHGDIAVAALALDGPAAHAGLALNATLAAIGDTAVASLPVPRPGRWDRLYALQDALEQTVARQGRVTFRLDDGPQITVVGQPVCQVRFLMDDSKGNAGANRDVVRIGRPMAEVAHWDEAEIAALIAHEMAHAVLDHQTWLETSKDDVTRRTEREADRLSVWLLANAGYDPQGALRWMRRIGPRYQVLFIAAPSHGSWRTRVRDMTDEIAAMTAAKAANSQGADWPDLFRREEGAPPMPRPAKVSP